MSESKEKYGKSLLCDYGEVAQGFGGVNTRVNTRSILPVRRQHVSARHSARHPASTFILIMIMSTLVVNCDCSAPGILVLPESINTTLANKTVQMMFTAEAESVSILVNGTNAEVIDGFDISTSRNNSLIISILTIKVSLTVNNTIVLFLAYNSDNTYATSDPVTILVQGPLDPVEATAIKKNASALIITWTPPPTLIGTVVNGYNVSSTSSGETIFTKETFVLLNITNPDPCIEIIVTITPFNGVDGQSTTINEIYLPATNLPQNSSTISFYRPSFGGVGMINISINLDISRLCPGEIPTRMSVVVNPAEPTSNIAEYRFGLLPSEDRSLRVSSGSIELMENQGYCIDVLYTDEYGSFEMSSLISINKDCTSVLNLTTITKPTVAIPIPTKDSPCACTTKIKDVFVYVLSAISSIILCFMVIYICYKKRKGICCCKSKSKEVELAGIVIEEETDDNKGVKASTDIVLNRRTNDKVYQNMSKSEDKDSIHEDYCTKAKLQQPESVLKRNNSCPTLK